MDEVAMGRAATMLIIVFAVCFMAALSAHFVILTMVPWSLFQWWRVCLFAFGFLNLPRALAGLQSSFDALEEKAAALKVAPVLTEPEEPDTIE